jgi:RimJ/RimL family protein N-acetyltransferase
MQPPIIRPARVDEYDEIARVWMKSWVSTGLAEASPFLLANLRARVRHEIEKGWSLYVADDGGTLAAMLALHMTERYLDQLFWLRCVRENDKAWRWYEREGFVFEKEAIEPMNGFVMKYYRWKKQEMIR